MRQQHGESDTVSRKWTLMKGVQDESHLLYESSNNFPISTCRLEIMASEYQRTSHCSICIHVLWTCNSWIDFNEASFKRAGDWKWSAWLDYWGFPWPFQWFLCLIHCLLIHIETCRQFGVKKKKSTTIFHFTTATTLKCSKRKVDLT